MDGRGIWETREGRVKETMEQNEGTLSNGEEEEDDNETRIAASKLQ